MDGCPDVVHEERGVISEDEHPLDGAFNQVAELLCEVLASGDFLLELFVCRVKRSPTSQRQPARRDTQDKETEHNFIEFPMLKDVEPSDDSLSQIPHDRRPESTDG